MVVGGECIFGEVAGEQLYDSPAGTFIATGNLSTARSSHTATLLPDGSVLIAGGAGRTLTQYAVEGELFANAELYAPDNGTFAKTGDMTLPRRWHTATLLNNRRVLVAGGSPQTLPGSPPRFLFTSTAEIYTPSVLVAPPALLSVSGDGKGPGAIQHANTYQLVSPGNPAIPGEVLLIYFAGLKDGSLIPPQVAMGGRMAEVLWFGNTPGFVGLNQVNVRVPTGVGPGPTIPVRLTYLSRLSNEVTISVQ